MKQILICLVSFLMFTSTMTAQDDVIDPFACISILGDSMAYGTQVVELSGTGYATIQTVPFSQILTASLQENGLADVSVYDFSLPATAILSIQNNMYLDSSEYASAQEQACEIILVFPWLNDLAAVNRSFAFSDYSIALYSLLTPIRLAHPDAQILLLSYYHAPLTQVGEATYGELRTEVIQGMNSIHEQYSSSSLSIDCLDLGDILNPIEDFVSLRIFLNEFHEYGYIGLDESSQINLDTYCRSYPSRFAIGDGIHLNMSGKENLSWYIVETIMD